MQFGPQRLPQPQNRAISDTFFSQLFLYIDNRRKIESRKTRFVGRPPLSRLRRRFGPLRGTQRRCAALRAAPPGRYATRALRAQPFLEHEKKAHSSRTLDRSGNKQQNVVFPFCVTHILDFVVTGYTQADATGRGSGRRRFICAGECRRSYAAY